MWNPKAAKWRKGRKNLFDEIQAKFIGEPAGCIWVHCSSVGEFEQAKPVIERIKGQGTRDKEQVGPDDPVRWGTRNKLVLTFFSPSGYEANKNYPLADFVFYLPLDSAGHAKKFLNMIKPSLIIWVKYDFWYYYLREINQKQIPCILISAVFRKQQIFFQWFGGLQRTMLSFFTKIFVQDEISKQLAKTIGIENCEVAGDTRFDRVIEIAENFKPLQFIEDFLQNSKCMVAGSTWWEDEAALRKVYELFKEEDLKLIIAPHEIDRRRIEEIENLFPTALKFSEIKNDPVEFSRRPAELRKILIIDNIGMLSKLYHYGYINYVGGGFTKDGVHNVLEAAVYAKPVLFGPNFKKYREATGLIEAGGAKSFSNDSELNTHTRLFIHDAAIYTKHCEASKNFVWENKGAAEKIFNYIQENRLLTS